MWTHGPNQSAHTPCLSLFKYLKKLDQVSICERREFTWELEVLTLLRFELTGPPSPLLPQQVLVEQSHCCPLIWTCSLQLGTVYSAPHSLPTQRLRICHLNFCAVLSICNLPLCDSGKSLYLRQSLFWLQMETDTGLGTVGKNTMCWINEWQHILHYSFYQEESLFP
jgi:hypothetical protein